MCVPRGCVRAGVRACRCVPVGCIRVCVLGRVHAGAFACGAYECAGAFVPVPVCVLGCVSPGARGCRCWGYVRAGAFLQGAYVHTCVHAGVPVRARPQHERFTVYVCLAGATSGSCPRRMPAARPAGSPAGRTRRAAARRRTRWPRHSRRSSTTSCDLQGAGRTRASCSVPRGHQATQALGYLLFSRKTCIFAELHIQKHNFAEIGVFRDFTTESLLF